MQLSTFKKPTQNDRPYRFVFLNPETHMLIRAYQVKHLTNSLKLKTPHCIIEAPTEGKLEMLLQLANDDERALLNSCELIETVFNDTYAKHK